MADVVFNPMIKTRYTKAISIEEWNELNRALGEVAILTNKINQVYAGITLPGGLIDQVNAKVDQRLVDYDTLSLATLDATQREHAYVYVDYNGQVNKVSALDLTLSEEILSGGNASSF